MKANKIIIAVLVIAAIGAFLWLYPLRKTVDQSPEPVVTEELNQYSDLIQITSPKPGERISSTTPLVVTGKARGGWYFEATFPIVVVNWDGLIIGEGYAEAQDEWMTEEFVPFKGTINFEKPTYGERGAVIFRNSNASGDPVNDKAVEIPILFK